MQATLRIVHQRANLQEIRLDRDTLVGRSTDCQLKIASTQVSRRHCRLSLGTDGVYLEDLGSANGTFLDGVRIDAATPTYVPAGARLDIGPARFIVDYSVSDSSTKLLGPDTAMLRAGQVPSPDADELPAAQEISSDDALEPPAAEDVALQQFLRQL